MEKVRKGWVAGFFSLILPGLGQLYCGNLLRALFQLILIVVLGNTVFYLFFIDTIKPFNIVIPILILLLFYAYIMIDSVKTAKRIKSIELKWFMKWYIYIVYTVTLNLIFSYTNIFANYYESFTIPSVSMEDTIFVGDYFIADMNRSGYMYDDLAIFLNPNDKTTKYIKRVIGLPGDTIDIIDKIVFINGKERIEPKTIKHLRSSIQPRRPNGSDSPDNFGPYIVPAESYFMMGDSRDNSQDSRWFKAVPIELILGKSEVIYFSNDFGRIGLRIK